MTETRIIVSILFAVVLMGLLWNLVLTGRSYYDIKDMRVRGINGARETLALSRFRRHWLRLLKQAGLLGIWLPRVLFDHNASPVWVFFFGLLLVSALTYETVQDWLDRHRVRWFLQTGREHGDDVSSRVVPK